MESLALARFLRPFPRPRRCCTASDAGRDAEDLEDRDLQRVPPALASLKALATQEGVNPLLPFLIEWQHEQGQQPLGSNVPPPSSGNGLPD
jgi:hypothetical protein